MPIGYVEGGIREWVANDSEGETMKFSRPIKYLVYGSVIIGGIFILGFGCLSAFHSCDQHLHDQTFLAAVTSDDTERTRLLIGDGANVTGPNEWREYPFIASVQQNLPRMVRLLLDAGAKVNARDDLGQTALDYARRSKPKSKKEAEANHDIQQMLLRAGAKTSKELDAEAKP